MNLSQKRIDKLNDQIGCALVSSAAVLIILLVGRLVFQAVTGK